MADEQSDPFVKLSDTLGEVEVTIGASSRPAVALIRRKLIEAAAARGSGDVSAGVHALHQAMEQLAALAGTLDPTEGALMNLIAQRLTSALALNDRDAAKDSVNFIRHRAGDPKDDPNTDW